MASIYRRGSRIYYRVKQDGKWVGIPSPFSVGQEHMARAALEKSMARVEAGEALPGAGPVTVRRFYESWLVDRKQKVSTWRNDEATFRLHVLPVIGEERIDKVRPRHVDTLVRGWRAKLAPKSVWTAYSSLSAYFRDAAIQDLISTSPCILTRHQLGQKRDKNPEWRATAQFGREELERLISDARIPADRRVHYALEGVAGLRQGEASALPWRNCPVQPQHEPLGMLLVAVAYDSHNARLAPVKGEIPRPMPIHPTLAAVLAEWRLHGWPAMMGRKPGPDDLVLPLPPGAKSKHAPYRHKGYSYDRLEQDLALLEMRHRRGHDLRRTFISLARSDGANRDILRRGTHKPPREVFEGYTTFEWDVLCREVAKLKVQRRSEGRLAQLATGRATTEGEVPMMIAESGVALPGLERGNSSNESAGVAPSGAGIQGDASAPGDSNAGSAAVGRSNVANDYEARALALGFRLVKP